MAATSTRGRRWSWLGPELARVLAVVLAACVCPRLAFAEGLPVALHWTRGPGAESCIGPTELAQRIEARLGRAVFEPAGTAEFALEGHIQPSSEGGYTVLLALNDAAGQQLGVRELASPIADCRQLDDAITLVIAVTLYPEQGLAGAGIALPDDVAALLGSALEKLEQTAPQAQPVAQPVAQPRRDQVPPPVPAVDPAASWRFAILGAGSGTFGTTPSGVLGGHVGVGIVPPHLPAFEASAAFASEDSTALTGDGTDGTLFVSSSRYALSVCTRWDGLSWFETSGCLGLEALLTQARSEGLALDGDATLLAPAPFVAARAAIWLGDGFALQASALAGVPINRAQLQFRSMLGTTRSAYEVSALYAELAVGLTWMSGAQ